MTYIIIEYSNAFWKLKIIIFENNLINMNYIIHIIYFVNYRRQHGVFWHVFLSVSKPLYFCSSFMYDNCSANKIIRADVTLIVLT